MPSAFDRRTVISAVAALVALFAVATLIVGLIRRPGWQPVFLVAEFTAAAAASLSAVQAAHRCGEGRRRRAWRWLAAGFAFWAGGSTWWMVSDAVLGRPVAVPSPADIGFLMLPPLVAVALITHPVTLGARTAQRLRLVLDATTITLALMLALWALPGATVLDVSARGAREIITLAYPISDVLLSLLVFTLLAYRPRRTDVGLLWGLAALLVMTIADFSFWWLTHGEPISTITIADPLWVVSFGFWTVAAVRETGATEPPEPVTAPSYSALPHVLLSGSLLVVVARWLAGEPIDTPTVVMLGGVVALVYLRQQILLRDNRRLLGQVDQGREQLRRTRVQDPLTGLPNLAGFLELADRALTGSPELPWSLVKLRPLHTQTLEQVSADEIEAIAAELAGRIGRCVSPRHVLGRLTEVTFAVLLPEDEKAAVRLAQRILLRVDPSVPTPRHRLQINLVAGVATVLPGRPDRSADTLMQRSAIALSNATAPGAVSVTTPQMLREYADQFHLQEAVVRALRDEPAGSVGAHFEPVVELSSGRLAAVAARPAWNDDGHGAVTAGRLIKIAGEAGLTGRIDEIVITNAIARFGEWNRRWPGVCGDLWITVCAETLTGGLNGEELPDRLLTLLDAGGLQPSVLVLELLEGLTGRTQREALLRTLARLQAEGVRFAASDAMALAVGHDGSGLDDRVTADFFDISPLVVERCVDDLRARRVVQATVEFATDRDSATAARRVSTTEQHEELLRAGCTLARGPLYGESRPDTAMAGLLARVAAGAWHTPAADLAQRHRSVWAWQELRQVVSGLPIAAFACDLDGKVILAEGALLEKLGGAHNALGRPLADLFPIDDPPWDLDAYELDEDTAAADAAGESRRGPAERSPAAVLGDALNGVPAVTTLPVRGRWLQVHLSPGHAPDGAVTGALGVVIDVTHRVRAERALRRSEQRFKTMFEQAPVGILIVGPDGRVDKTNNAFAELVGHPLENLWGSRLTDLWHEDTPPESWEEYDAVRSGRVDHFHAERAYRHRDGSAVWTRVAVARLQGANAPGTTIAVVEDKRQLKQLEVELRHAQKMEAVGMLAAGIAHEINTPIQFVGDNLDFLADAFGRLTYALTARQRLSRPVDQAAAAELADILSDLDLPWLMEEVPGAVEQSMEGVSRVAGIVRAMRNFGHPDRQAPSAIDVNAAIRDTTTVARNEYKYVADLILDLGDVPMVPGYPSQFHQVILNLLVNAAQAIEEVVNGTERRGAIHIRSWADEGGVHMSVADDGCGMSADTKARIFDPFFTTKPVGRGTGQGLTIVRNVVVDKHHGSIGVQSTPGAGSVFTVNLPLPAPAATAPPDLPAEGARPEHYTRS